MTLSQAQREIASLSRLLRQALGEIERLKGVPRNLEEKLRKIEDRLSEHDKDLSDIKKGRP